MRLVTCFLLLLFATARAEQCLVIGDSLTKEYEVEFAALFPTNPAALQARNWIEILHQHRTDWFDTGVFDTWADIRATGHAHNWAVPGATTGELKSLLTNFLNQILWVNSLKNHIRYDVERVVIFAGGNDADSYYANLYNGLVGREVTTTTENNLQWLVGWVRALKPSMPIVLVSVPHVGCTPKVQQGYPTDLVKTGRVTAAMDFLNAKLAEWAQSEGIGFVPGVYAMTKALITDPFRINGIEFYRVADADARPRYVFSGDGFHPSTCAHAKIAQMVVQAFNTTFHGTPITPLDDDYLTATVLGLDPNLPFNEWMTTQGLSGSFSDDSNGNGVPNLIEFALDQPAMPLPVMQSGALSLTYRPRTVFTEWGTLKVQSSTNLLDWTDVPENQITTNPDGTRTVNAAVAEKAFLRFRATP
ncbi:MAG: SGNH/GDSL hydrolase family protein [Verrucomicrobiaceae bacterium]